MASSERPRQAIQLKILSPSTEVGTAGLLLDDIPVTSTVAELRDRIRDAVSTRPAHDRQRLIYLGRALVRETDTLLDVFGANAIQEQQLHTLHLVLRETHPVPPSVTSNPNPATVPTGTAGNPSRPQPQVQQPQSIRSSTTSQGYFRAPQTPPVQQPQPQPIPNPIARILGNAQVRATANGVPVDLPPELVNTLLNQHFQQHGQIPNLFSTIQQHQQELAQQRRQTQAEYAVAALHSRIQHLQHHLDSIPAEQGQQRQEELNEIAELQRQVVDLRRQTPSTEQGSTSPQQGGTEMRNTEEQVQDSGDTAPQSSVGQSFNNSLPSVGEPIAENHASQPAQHPGPNVPITNVSESHLQPAAFATAPVGHGHAQPNVVYRSVVLPDGTRWTMNTNADTNDPNMQHQIPGASGVTPFTAPQFPQHHHQYQQPGMPILVQPQFPPQMPYAFMHNHMVQPARMATPPTGLRPVGTPRSVSPARSVSEGQQGQRRIGTPAAELQNRLESTRREIENVNRLLGVVSTGTMASGDVAPPLTDDALLELRTFSDSMVRHIDGFGSDLNALANALQPSVRLQPEFVSLQGLYHTVYAQGRAIQRQVQQLASNRSTVATPHGPFVPAALRGRPRDNPPPTASNQQPSSHELSGGPAVTLTQTSLPFIPSSIGPVERTTVPNLQSPPPSAELHVLMDPSGTPQALLVGPTGRFITPILPPEILYGLLAAQLPHDQLVRDFNQILREAVYPPQEARNYNDFFATGLPNLPTGNMAQVQQALANNDAHLRQAVQGNQPQPATPQVPANQAAPQDVAPNNQGPRAQQQLPAARGVHGEMRDVLGPLVRNIWIFVRVLGFAYFFLASGRGHWRMLILGSLALVVHALNSGWLGQNMEGLWERIRRHFEALINAPVQQPADSQVGATQGHGEGPSDTQAIGGQGGPRPEDMTRRLVEQQQGRNRTWVTDRLREVERTIALFIASLWPGVGENLIQAQERAAREAQERTIREEQQRRDEEARRREETDAQSQQGKARTVAEPSSSTSQGFGSTGIDASLAQEDTVNRVNKGKNRASEEDVEKQNALSQSEATESGSS